MTGPHDSILGRRYDRVLSATLTLRARAFRRRHRRPTIERGALTIDPLTGRALSISRVSFNQDDTQRLLTDRSNRTRPMNVPGSQDARSTTQNVSPDPARSRASRSSRARPRSSPCETA